MEKKALARYLAVILLSGLSFTAVANTTFKARTNIK